MSQHTPGPWKAEEYRNTYEIWGQAMGRVAAIEKEAGDYPHAEANARLIAKAPEMLEALKRIARGEGAFNRDPLKHAGNVIEEHKEIARALLREIEEGDA